MDKNQLNTILAAISLAMKHGFATVQKILENLKKDTITAEDIAKLEITKE
jgi:hypothetical protein